MNPLELLAWAAHMVLALGILLGAVAICSALVALLLPFSPERHARWADADGYADEDAGRKLDTKA